jgi:thiamine-monophosphate kinase
MADSNRTLSQIGEFGLIAGLASRLPKPGPEVFLGIGDDAAALDLGNGRLLLATCDIQMENVHFTMNGFTPEQIGMKAAAVNLSDIAAMGGEPKFALVSIALPSSTEEDFVFRLYEGLSRSLSKWNTVVIGGNTSSSSGGLVIDITLLGEVQKSKMLTRRGARPGDALLVTGDLGASRLGLMIILSNYQKRGLSEGAIQEALARHRTPMPRLAEIQAVAGLGALSSCIDISDGLLGDAAHLSLQSGIQVVIEQERVPISACVREAALIGMAAPVETAFQGGEDFELLFTAPKHLKEEIIGAISRDTGTRVTEIGEICEGEGVVVRQKDGTLVNAGRGFDHFR